MHERKKSVHSPMASFGQKLNTSSSDATMPATTNSVRARSDALIQSSVGAYQVRSIGPSCEATP